MYITSMYVHFLLSIILFSFSELGISFGRFDLAQNEPVSIPSRPSFGDNIADIPLVELPPEFLHVRNISRREIPYVYIVLRSNVLKYLIRGHDGNGPPLVMFKLDIDTDCPYNGPTVDIEFCLSGVSYMMHMYIMIM